MTIMKIKNIFLTLAVAVASSACSDWFDVSPKTDIKTDDLFKDETGFQSALTGCYGNMTKDKTYGKNLTWYFLEKLVRHSLDRASMSTTIRTPIIPRASSPTSGTRCMRPLLTSTT